MKIKTPLQMETFNDGVLSVYESDENGNLQLKIENIRFGNRVIGAKRFYAAAQAQIEFSNLVRIPMLQQISNYDVVVLGVYQYEIKQIQHIYDSNPPVTDLTLRQREKFVTGN